MELLGRDDPSSVGPYRLLARLGQGGMGQVYLARSASGALVAVKVVHAAYAGDMAFRRRFAHEVAAARQVQGDYTVAVLDSDTEAGLPWLVTEYVRGRSLADTVQIHGPLPEHMVRALGCGVALALQAIHAAGVVHRDVKPSNVLMAADGPRLVDFGVSRATEASTLTATGQVVGSAGYMAPEQVEGRTVDGQADVFALGAVLVYALTGNGPFGEGSAASLLFRVVHGSPDVPEIADPDLAETIRRCLSKDPAQRPGPAEIVAALGPAPSTGFVPSDWLPEEAPTAPIRQQGAGLTTLTAIPRNEVDSQLEDLAADRTDGGAPRRRRRPLIAVAVAVTLLALGGVAYAVGPWSRDTVVDGPSSGGTTPAAARSMNTTTQPSASSPSSPSPPPPPTAPSFTGSPPPGVTRPSMPTNLTAAPMNSSTIRLLWSDNSSNEDGFLLNNQGSTVEVGADTTSYDWGGLPPGTFACFAVAAFNGAGYSSYYPTADPGWVCAATTQPPVSPSESAPTTPSGLSATAIGTTAIRLQWVDNSSTETGFEIANATGTSRTTNAGATQYDWTGLAPGTSMCFHIRAYNDAGFSAFSPASATVCATTPGPPADPTNFTVTQINSSTVRLQWNDNSGNETGFAISHGMYRWWPLYESPLYPVPDDVTVGANVTSYDFSLPAGSWRCFTLRAFNAEGSSSGTDYTCASGSAAVAPASPTNLNVTVINSTYVQLQWVDNSNNEAFMRVAASGANFDSPAVHLINSIYHLPPNTTSIGAQVQPGTEYCFYVGSGNPIDTAGTGVPVCVTTPS